MLRGYSFFRADYSEISEASPELMQERMKQWAEWIGSIATQNKLAEGGNHLDADGKLVNANGEITNGPYAVNNESVLGYILVKAASYKDALEFAKTCPILRGEGNSVEVREIKTL